MYISINRKFGKINKKIINKEYKHARERGK